MAAYRALLVLRDKIAQNQRWTIYYFSGSHGIYPKRVAGLSLANSRRHTSIRLLSTTPASHCGAGSRPSPIFSYKRLNWAASEVRLIKLLPQKDPEDNGEDWPVACRSYEANVGKEAFVSPYLPSSPSYEGLALSIIFH